MAKEKKPIVIITGSEGSIGKALKKELKDDYTVVGFDRSGTSCDIEFDITEYSSVKNALKKFKKQYGKNVASVIHLAAYFDFTGEDSPLYDTVNVVGTEYLLEGLKSLDVERFVYSGTMLVHEPCAVGELINEKTAIKPKWAYPESKAKAEDKIVKHHGKIPYTILRLAGLYDENSAIPTLMHQISRIYEKELKSFLYAGDSRAGQAFIHKKDMVSLFKKVIDKRKDLPKTGAILAGEPEVIGYEELQNTIGKLIHGKNEWNTISLPKPIAKAGAYVEEQAEPIIPDAFDEGEKPFIKPFMVDMASDHYALDIKKAKELLGWQPKHNIKDILPKIIDKLKNDPAKWYKDNNINPPEWIESADEKNKNPENIRKKYDEEYKRQHHKNIWAHFLNIALGFWLASSPLTMNYQSTPMMWSDIIAGFLIIICASCSLSTGKWLRLARFDTALVGMWLLFAPLIFWAPTSAAYLNSTIVGALVIGFSLLVRPFPAMSPTAAMSGPEVPPGWDFSPSSWFQRAPIILLAFIGFYISRYMTAYQLGHIDAVWDPFFGGYIPQDGKNGTEEIITSSISKAWPVPDAGLGALTYLLEILTGMIGSNKRWRTMPWLVLLFGFMIIPLGAISITFIIIQPILLGTWCTLCLIAAAAMLIQIPYSFDEIVATIEFLRRKAKVGKPWMKILFTGDTDEGNKKDDKDEDNFSQKPSSIIYNIFTGGVTIPWNLALCGLIGLWLMFTRLTLGTEGGMANADHLIGSLIITITITAFAEVARSLRFLNIFLGMALLIIPFVYGAGVLAIISSVICGFALIALSLRKGEISNNWGEWNKFII